MKIRKSTLIRAGYDEKEINNALSMDVVKRIKWELRPNFAIDNGKILFCQSRCLHSYMGGGNCMCINHPPEDWVEVVDE